MAHPIMWERVLRNRRNPHLIVVDPRRTETAMAATSHLAIQPKSDLTLFYGVAQQLIAKGWVDEAYVANHTSGFEAFAQHVAPFTLSRVAEETGLSPYAIEAFTATIHDSPRVSFWWTMGVNQSYQGVRTAQSLINLALMTGNFGRPGTGANSITGQCNAMGSRLLSNTSALVGGRDFTSASDRDEVAQLLEIPVAKIPNQNSLCYDQILDQIHAGKIKGLWIIATNTAHSWVQQGSVQEALKSSIFWWCKICIAPPRRPIWPMLCCPQQDGERKKGHSSIRNDDWAF
ncbi:MAG: molybdopterin-dependent oxidoreductase [Pirellulales bacterium]